MKPRALLSVSDKRGLDELARGLLRLGFELLSTGGTLAFLAGRGLPVRPVTEITGYPEILDGRVKTLHPRIHGGILARRSSPQHLAQLAEHGIRPIDLVVVNLYPFRETAAAAGAAPERVVESIDVGGPAMLRAAAKNFEAVAAVVDPDDYQEVLAALESEGGGRLPEGLRRRLAAKAFRHTHDYDGAIASWLEGRGEEVESTRTSAPRDLFPERLSLTLERVTTPRYGENPHQPAAVYGTPGGPGILGGFTQLQGKGLSWNNLLDADAARKAVAGFAEPAVVIVKHNTPCGVGRGDDLAAAWRWALATDPVSAYGSVVAVNRTADAAFAEVLADLFIEVLVAPAFDEGARGRLAAKPGLRLLACPAYAPRSGEMELRAIDGALLAQVPDASADDRAAWRCVTRREPTPEERRALELAWEVVRYVKSNAIVLAGPDRTVGIGAGQMSRVDACDLAVRKMRQSGLAMAAASDAFFPFRDGLDLLAAAGVTAVVQPGGSKRDEEVVAAADEHGMAMLFTGIRHFRH